MTSFTQHIDSTLLQEMDTRFRANFINSLSGFKSANLIGTKSLQGITNLAMISSVVHLGASPALMGFISRPDTVERDTLSNIKDTESFTINHVNSEIWQGAHQCSARYPANESEFEKTGLTQEYYPNIYAPFVAESLLKIALEVREIIPIPLNNTLFIIGQVTDVFVENSIVSSDGYINIEDIDSIAVSGLDSYHVTTRLSRLSYAKPNKPVELIDTYSAPPPLQK